MTSVRLVQVSPVTYKAMSRCELCTFRDDGVEARLKGINHTKETGHHVAIKVDATEVVKPYERRGGTKPDVMIMDEMK